MQNVDPEKLFKDYLIKVGIAHLPKNSVQYIELKRAFIGGLGSSLRVLLETFNEDMSEDDAVDILDNLFKYVKEFFEKESRIEENRRITMVAKRISKFKN